MPTASASANVKVKTAGGGVASVFDWRVGEDTVDKLVPTGIAWAGLIIGFLIPLIEELAAQQLIELTPGVQALVQSLTVLYVGFHARGSLRA
jgi:hypothetical protein